jgi:sugar (pentulose or hexulose) kinase
MSARATIVLDVGKTLSKLSLWTPEGHLLERRTRPNPRIGENPGIGHGQYATLDAAGIEHWVGETLRELAQLAHVGSIVPVSHGAAAAVILDGALVQAPLDYESPMPADVRREYDALRDPFANTGSPALPVGLNLGAQLFYQESLNPTLFAPGSTVLPWPQYWSWLLSGVAASEVTSLGCHTDLWNPLARTHSALSTARGWAQRIAPLQPAGAILGPLLPRWAQSTGLPPDTQIYCGLHDSNAALHAARGFPEIASHEATILSTGTWFVAMRILNNSRGGDNVAFDMASLAESRDCLVNVDAWGNPVPSARFMGGREIELLTGLDARRVDLRLDQQALLGAVGGVLASGAMVLPTFASGSGPFPEGRGRWISMPEDPFQQRAAVALYAALMADVSLDLIGSRGRVLVEGRFAESDVFVRALAALRPRDIIFVGHTQTDVAFGALRLVHPSLPAPAPLTRIQPLAEDLQAYRLRWRGQIVSNANHNS